jgi:hypothetical protein
MTACITLTENLHTTFDKASLKQLPLVCRSIPFARFCHLPSPEFPRLLDSPRALARILIVGEDEYLNFPIVNCLQNFNPLGQLRTPVPDDRTDTADHDYFVVPQRFQLAQYVSRRCPAILARNQIVNKGAVERMLGVGR